MAARAYWYLGGSCACCDGILSRPAERTICIEFEVIETPQGFQLRLWIVLPALECLTVICPSELVMTSGMISLPRSSMIFAPFLSVGRP